MAHGTCSGIWLVQHIHDAALKKALRQYASGLLLDIGCGEKHYKSITEGLVATHIGLDHPHSAHSKSQVDVMATAYETSIADGSVDTILCTAVLEHLERPQDAVNEMCRILKLEGHVILSAPLYWHLHEEPRDFFRYTRHGLQHMFTAAGLDVLDIKPLSGFVVTFNQELVYFLNRLRRGCLQFPVMLVQAIIQALAFWLNRWDRSYSFTWAYLVVATKTATSRQSESK